MGMSTSVAGVVPADEKYMQMKEISDKCRAAGISSPPEVDDYFGGDFSKSEERDNLQSLGFKKKSYGIEKYFERFDLEKHPNEANKFGYIVEIDPFNPNKAPIKHTSLGRFKHESATVFKDASGHIIVYMADDENFEHLYKIGIA